MSEFPPNLSDENAEQFWNSGRVRLAVVAIVLVVILVLAVLVSLMPTICCNIFSNVVNAL